jgi:hypothetical protein
MYAFGMRERKGEESECVAAKAAIARYHQHGGLKREFCKLDKE